MKINFTVDEAELIFIKHSVQEQAKILAEYLNAMHRVASYMQPAKKASANANQEFAKAYAERTDEFVKKEPAKRRGRPPLKKTV